MVRKSEKPVTSKISMMASFTCVTFMLPCWIIPSSMGPDTPDTTCAEYDPDLHVRGVQIVRDLIGGGNPIDRFFAEDVLLLFYGGLFFA